MLVKDVKFRVTLPNGHSFVFGFEDLFGYEGESQGVFIQTDMPSECICVNYNSGYGFEGLDEDFGNCMIEIIDPEFEVIPDVVL